MHAHSVLAMHTCTLLWSTSNCHVACSVDPCTFCTADRLPTVPGGLGPKLSGCLSLAAYLPNFRPQMVLQKQLGGVRDPATKAVILAQHNALRGDYGAGKLTWSVRLAHAAQVPQHMHHGIAVAGSFIGLHHAVRKRVTRDGTHQLAAFASAPMTHPCSLTGDRATGTLPWMQNVTGSSVVLQKSANRCQLSHDVSTLRSENYGAAQHDGLQRSSGLVA
jgi:hypothetical protein